MRWTYKLFNDLGISARADLYLDGKWTGLSSRRSGSLAQLHAEAQAVCEALNKAYFHDFHVISTILEQNSAILVYFGPFCVDLAYYWPNTGEKLEK